MTIASIDQRTFDELTARIERDRAALAALNGSDLTDAEVLVRWRRWQKAQGLSERTIRERQVTAHAYALHTGQSLLELTPDGIIDFCSREHLSASTKASYHATIRALCAWLIRAELRTDDPSKKTPSPKRRRSAPRPPKGAAHAQLAAHCDRQNTRDYIALASLAGMRVHEIAKIRGEDIDTVAGTITITGKGSKTDTIAVHPEIITLALQRPRTGYWFPNEHDNIHGPAGTTHIRSHAVSQAISNAMRRAGMADTPHALRHWYATNLVRQGAPLAIVQKLMRHSSPATTTIYTEINMDQQTQFLNLLAMPGAQAGAL